MSHTDDDAALRAETRARQIAWMARLLPLRADYLPALERSIYPGYRFPWRIAECPGVAPRRLVERDLTAMRAILDWYARDEIRAGLLPEIPERYRRPAGPLVFPRFIATDFQRVFDPASGGFTWCVPEVQSFPGNMLLKPAKLAAWRAFVPDLAESQFFLDRRFETLAAYRAWLQAAVLGRHAGEDTIVLEVRPMQQSTVVDMLEWCRLLGARLVDVLDLEPDPHTGALCYRRAVVFDGERPREVTFDRPAVARNVLSRCIPPELDQLLDECLPGFDEARLDAIFRQSIARGAAEFVVHPQDFFVISKATLVGNPAHHPPLHLFEPALLARLDAAGVPIQSGVVKPAYFAGGHGVRGISSALQRDELIAECARVDALRRAQSTVSGRLRHTWLWQRKYGCDPLERNAVPGFVPAIADDAGPVYQEIRYMWALDPHAPPGALEFVPLVGMTRWSRVGLPANASFQKTAFTGTQGFIVEDESRGR